MFITPVIHATHTLQLKATFNFGIGAMLNVVKTIVTAVRNFSEFHHKTHDVFLPQSLPAMSPFNFGISAMLNVVKTIVTAVRNFVRISSQEPCA